ncbi:2-hydroxyacyl-CoA dehydratase subunit D [Papillibacter cinnamivorans]|uniref:Benzoyl-CoA reductase/2-hydroxyglutaryl-CoA dehydratase subunit, BcrC/BadD/HgdB n=1 Tax=Papillibacter cinnamivorans DSM 12816 TaxID=1122930 RepID=A0A1W2BAI4_9FIRM|nr:2-hydroxyacyl-CoA dehydratase family protein [Papillibacter cinnamivorans]SMC69997.1 Benzoyl-CoA reductase/2-hydroxyglutaryl-CoA dehydratase subunit, BcrC/BadD/HgdB [Papillibacter cinnamivorans DSM 12816]
MPDSNLNSRKLSAKLTAEYYERLYTAKARGKLVAWATSIVPQELLETMNVEVAYPENHAAAIASRKGALPFLERAENSGYSNDICSYARVNLGYSQTLESEILNLPKPDFVICINNICNVVVKWYECLARYFNVPYILIDVPFNHEYEVNQSRVDYIKAQFQDAIVKLEEICGKPFDYDRFEKVMEISQRAARAWRRAMDYAHRVPSPMIGFNMFNYMALIVCLRGREEAVLLFETVAAEMEALMAEGKSQFPGEEKYRILWDGIAVWPHLAHTVSTLHGMNVNMTGSTYPDAWTILYDVGDLDGMAKAYASIMNNICVQRQVDLRTQILTASQCDGAVYHLNRSCKVMDFMQFDVRKRVHDATGKPYAVFDGDQSDPRNYAEAQYETRMQALVESMDEQKK